MYNKSKIFSQAWARVRKTGEAFATALKNVWDFYRKHNIADKTACNMISIWEKLNSEKTVEGYTIYSKKVNEIIVSLRSTYATLAKINTDAAIMTANIIASVVNKKYNTPTYPQMFAIICGAWENGIILS